jgi:hypothetical protein
MILPTFRLRCVFPGFHPFRAPRPSGPVRPHCGQQICRNPRRSMPSDIDAEFASGKQFEAAMGEDGIKKLEQLEAACVESSQHNSFVIDPKMSNPSEVMMKADPSFWKSK